MNDVDGLEDAIIKLCDELKKLRQDNFDLKNDLFNARFDLDVTQTELEKLKKQIDDGNTTYGHIVYCSCLDCYLSKSQM